MPAVMIGLHMLYLHSVSCLAYAALTPSQSATIAQSAPMAIWKAAICQILWAFSKSILEKLPDPLCQLVVGLTIRCRIDPKI